MAPSSFRRLLWTVLGGDAISSDSRIPDAFLPIRPAFQEPDLLCIRTLVHLPGCRIFSGKAPPPSAYHSPFPSHNQMRIRAKAQELKGSAPFPRHHRYRTSPPEPPHRSGQVLSSQFSAWRPAPPAAAILNASEFFRTWCWLQSSNDVTRWRSSSLSGQLRMPGSESAERNNLPDTSTATTTGCSTCLAS